MAGRPGPGSGELAFTVLLGALTIVFVFTMVFLLAYVLASSVARVGGFPLVFASPSYLRVFGLLLLAVGAAFVGWTFRSRRPRDVIVSTWATIQKLVGRVKMDEPAGRTEPFLPHGPYRQVRNPIYFGAVAVLFGLGFILGSIPILLWGLLMTVWFWFVLIPFEERELEILFGGAYLDYQAHVPKLLPTWKRYRVLESP